MQQMEGMVRSSLIRSQFSRSRPLSPGMASYRRGRVHAPCALFTFAPNQGLGREGNRERKPWPYHQSNAATTHATTTPISSPIPRPYRTASRSTATTRSCSTLCQLSIRKCLIIFAYAGNTRLPCHDNQDEHNFRPGTSSPDQQTGDDTESTLCISGMHTLLYVHTASWRIVLRFRFYPSSPPILHRVPGSCAAAKTCTGPA